MHEPVHKRTANMSFTAELKDFLKFLRAPRFSPRLPGQTLGDAWLKDWFAPFPVGRLFLWALLLWLVNLLIFGPIAVAAAGAGGAQHRLNLAQIPWLHAVLWAPLVEELVFRYGLRRPAQLCLILPIGIICLLAGPQWYVQILLALSLYLLFSRAAWSTRDRIAPNAGFWVKALAFVQGRPWPWSAYKRYRRYFPYVFYTATLAFAALHLYNFNLNRAPWHLWPLLVLPQAITGLVVGWLRIRRGIGAAIFLHAIFNAGPLLLVFLILKMAPDLTT